MSEFLKRNKKKGALAFLLLFFQRGRGLGPLLALLLILAFVFIAPNGSFFGSSFFDTMSKRLGLRGELGGADSIAMNGFSDGVGGGKGVARGLGMIGGLFGLGKGGEAQYGKSTVDMVKAGKDLAGRAGGEGDKFYDGVGKDAKSVDGVLRPDDAKNMEGGVTVSDSEMQSGLMAEAFGGKIQGGAGADGLAELRERLGAKAGGQNMMLARAGDRSADMMSSAYGNNRMLNVKGTGGGKLGWDKKKGPSFLSGKGDVAGKAGSKTVMYQLAEGKAYSVAAAPPPGHCDPGACPAEFASNVGGAVFDGGKVKGDILSSSEFGDPGVNVPDQGSIDTMLAQASQAEEDARKCEEAENQYGPQERAKMDQIGALSDQLNSMNCGSGGCSKSKYQACMAVGNQMKGVCREYNSVAAQKAAACPLMEGKYSAMDCNQ